MCPDRHNDKASPVKRWRKVLLASALAAGLAVASTVAFTLYVTVLTLD